MAGNENNSNSGCFSFTGCATVLAGFIIIVFFFGKDMLKNYSETQERRYMEEIALIGAGTYEIASGAGTLVIGNDKIVRIKMRGKVYAGTLETELWENYADGHVEIELSEPIPTRWDSFWGLETDWAYELYMDAQKRYLYFNYTALKAKDERNRWEITKINTSNDPVQNSQERKSTAYNDSRNTSYQNSDMSLSAREMVEIGEQYEKGRGREKDPQKAFNYYQKAAEAGEPTGLNKMGNMYSLGLGCTRNPATAFYYYKQSAEKGNMYAQYNLANCYWAGSGVEENKEIAIMWFRRSAAQGYKPARIFLQNIEEE